MFENLSLEQLVQLPVLATLIWYFALNTNKKIDVLQKAVDGFVYSAVRDENILQFGDDGVSEEVKQMIEQCKKEEKCGELKRVMIKSKYGYYMEINQQISKRRY